MKHGGGGWNRLGVGENGCGWVELALCRWKWAGWVEIGETWCDTDRVGWVWVKIGEAQCGSLGEAECRCECVRPLKLAEIAWRRVE